MDETSELYDQEKSWVIRGAPGDKFKIEFFQQDALHFLSVQSWKGQRTKVVVGEATIGSLDEAMTDGILPTPALK